MSASAPAYTGRGLGVALCLRCRQVARLPVAASGHGAVACCPRCSARLHLRKPDSLGRCGALLVAAALLYVPANLLPVMTTSTILGAQSDTIMSGVMVLVHSGSWPLGALVFFASIVVPLLKLLALSLLMWSATRRTHWDPLQATRLYRLVEHIGRWSMLDVYVVTLLVGLVQIQSLATIEAGGGAVAFGAVVVLSMLAALSFDPRLIWDRNPHGLPAVTGPAGL